MRTRGAEKGILSGFDRPANACRACFGAERFGDCVCFITDIHTLLDSTHVYSMG